jgi:hypothetical protein
VDTSHDFNSQTIDFMMGDGSNFLPPTHEDYAQVLFELGETLRTAGLLADAIGNYPVKYDRPLQRGIPVLEAAGEGHDSHSWKEMRAISILGLTGMEDG